MNLAEKPASAVSASASDVFCIADDASPHFGAYGCTWAKTPAIDRLAREGITFDRAYTPTAKCSPARAALLDVLDTSGQAKNTIVIVTSDHGMPFPRVKGHCFEAAHRVPPPSSAASGTT